MSVPTDEAVRARLATLNSSPDLLPQKLDLIGRRVLLLEVDERRYRQAPFLDDRMVDDDTKGFWVALDCLPAPGPDESVPDPALIFHIGHCGSTLLSRLLPAAGPLLPVREPPPLRTLAESLRLLEQPVSRLSRTQWHTLLGRFVNLYSRGYRQHEPALIKPTSDCGNLIGPALEARSASRAVLMYQSLETYLAIMMDGADARMDIEGHAVTRLSDLHSFIGDHESLRLFELTPPQRVVVSWLAGVTSFHLAMQSHAQQLRPLDFDRLLEDPRHVLAEVMSFLGLPVDQTRLAAAVDGPVMQTYAKAPEYRYGPTDRAARLAENRSRSGSEIEQGLRWAGSLVERYPSLEPVVAAFPMATAD